MSDLLTKVLNGNLTITAANAGEIIESAFSTLDGLCVSVYEAIKDGDPAWCSEKTVCRLAGKTPYVSQTTPGTRRVTTLPPAGADDKTLAKWWTAEREAKRASNHDAAQADPIRKSDAGWALQDVLPSRIKAVKAWARAWAPATASIEAELELAKTMLDKAVKANKAKALIEALKAEIEEIQERLDAALNA